MKINFSEGADADLDDIFAWIAKDSIDAAHRLVARIESRVRHLATPGLSYMGRLGQVHGTYELVERPYIIVYEVLENSDEIFIIAVFHVRRDRDNS